MKRMRVQWLCSLVSLLQRAEKKEASDDRLLGSQELLRNLASYQADPDWIKRAQRFSVNRLLELFRTQGGDERISLVPGAVLLSAWEVLRDQTIDGNLDMAVMIVLNEAVNPGSRS